MKIEGVHHAQVTVPSGRERDAREFYCGILGLTEIEKPEALKPRGGFWLQVEGFQVHIGIEDGIDRSSSRSHLAYLVVDLESWRTKLQNLHIPIQDGEPIPDFRRFEFRDPFGNRIEFLQYDR